MITTLAVRTKDPTMVALGPITRVTGRTTGAIWWPEGLNIKTMLEGTISTGRALALDMLPLPVAREDLIAAEVMAVVGVTGEIGPRELSPMQGDPFWLDGSRG